jgi:hypothetical protein
MGAEGDNGHTRDLSPSDASDGSYDQHPDSGAQNGSTGSPGIPDAPLAVNGNGAHADAVSTTVDIEPNGNGNGHARLGPVLAAWSIVSYGTVQRWGRQSPSCDLRAEPTGEGHPPAEFWIRRWLSAPLNERPAIAREADAELTAWRRRAPELNEIKTETLAELKRRILKEGDGWSAKDVALACRCTPTLVRRTREEAERNPEDGRVEGSLAHARELHAQGLSLRQIATLTGIPKSTLGDTLKP